MTHTIATMSNDEAVLLHALEASIDVGLPPRVLSMGAGVNSVAGLLRLVREGLAPDLVMFADTGEEHKRTYEYIESYIRPFCLAHDIPFVKVQTSQGRLVDYYTANSTVPSIVKRDCTDKFKVATMRRFMRTLDIEYAISVLGIAWDEIERMRTSDVKWVRNEYPLIDRRMTREACEAEIEAHGWPSPGKSGCVGCPFAGSKGLMRLYKEDPEEFARWERMEDKAVARNPKISLVPRVRLAWVRDEAKRESLRKALDEWEGGECLGGVCAPKLVTHKKRRIVVAPTATPKRLPDQW